MCTVRTTISTDRLSIRRWEIADGKPLRRTLLQWKEEGRVPLLTPNALTRDGRTFAAFAPEALNVWDAVTGEQRCRIKAKRTIFAPIAISEDGNLIAASYVVGEAGNPIHLWDARTGAELRQFRGQEKSAIGLDFSRDGKNLA